MSNSYEKPLNDAEFVELGELLAAMPEPFEPMEPSEERSSANKLSNAPSD